MDNTDEVTNHNAASARAGQSLRERAENSARHKTAPSPNSLQTLSPEAMAQLLHELQVHQIELEMQNDELRTAQLQLDAARAHYFDLYDLAPVGYCTLSDHGKILEVNFTAATLLGLTRSDLVGKPISRFIVKTQQDVFYLCRKRLKETGQSQTCELQMHKSDGSQLWVHLVATAAQDVNGAPVLRLMLSDIADRKFLDQALQETNIKLENARQAADKANLAKSEFLSSMSHELRSPLNAILGFAQLIEHGSPAPTPTQMTSLEQILHGGWYLLELINEILDLALIESGKLSLSMESISLEEVFCDCQAMIEPHATKHDIQINFAQFDNPCFVHADRTRVKQVMVNLLSNAIKYNRAGGTVDVTYRATATQRIRISVQDSGAGLTSEQLAQLFQPFNRLGQASGAKEGTGIGLAVCKRLVELMGGVIEAKSTVGVGSVFEFELNPGSAPKVYDADQSLATQPVEVQSGAPLRTLLYVEDNPANLQLVEQIIARRPELHLLTATDATRGIMLARTRQPEVILMDINLPGISGLDALKILREDPATQHIPVLAVSANAMPHDIEKGLAAGFFRYLTKPIKVNEFMAALDLTLAFVQPRSDLASSESVPP